MSVLGSIVCGIIVVFVAFVVIGSIVLNMERDIYD